MCHYSDVLGGGTALFAQALTSLSIAASIVFWVLIYRWQRIDLRPYAAPITLWVVFGTLDILITARGTLDDPMREGNPLARGIFATFGFFGPAIASVLWISLWSLLVLIINKKLQAPVAGYLSLAVFYSLAVGHVFGFSSWFDPLCDISRASWLLLPEWPLRFIGIVLLGCAFAGVHRAIAAIVSSWKGTGPVKGRSL